jgi:hypothetical protein
MSDRSHIHTYIHTYILTYIHTYIHTHITLLVSAAMCFCFVQGARFGYAKIRFDDGDSQHQVRKQLARQFRNRWPGAGVTGPVLS